MYGDRVPHTDEEIRRAQRFEEYAITAQIESIWRRFYREWRNERDLEKSKVKCWEQAKYQELWEQFKSRLATIDQEELERKLQGRKNLCPKYQRMMQDQEWKAFCSQSSGETDIIHAKVTADFWVRAAAKQKAEEVELKKIAFKKGVIKGSPENSRLNAEARRRTTQTDHRSTRRNVDGIEQRSAVWTASSLSPQVVSSSTASLSRQQQNHMASAGTLQERSTYDKTPEEIERIRRELKEKVAVRAVSANGKSGSPIANTAARADGEVARPSTLTTVLENFSPAPISISSSQVRIGRPPPEEVEHMRQEFKCYSAAWEAATEQRNIKVAINNAHETYVFSPESGARHIHQMEETVALRRIEQCKDGLSRIQAMKQHRQWASAPLRLETPRITTQAHFGYTRAATGADVGASSTTLARVDRSCSPNMTPRPDIPFDEIEESTTSSAPEYVDLNDQGKQPWSPPASHENSPPVMTLCAAFSFADRQVSISSSPVEAADLSEKGKQLNPEPRDDGLSPYTTLCPQLSFEHIEVPISSPWGDCTDSTKGSHHSSPASLNSEPTSSATPNPHLCREDTEASRSSSGGSANSNDMGKQTSSPPTSEEGLPDEASGLDLFSFPTPEPYKQPSPAPTSEEELSEECSALTLLSFPPPPESWDEESGNPFCLHVPG